MKYFIILFVLLCGCSNSPKSIVFSTADGHLYTITSSRDSGGTKVEHSDSCYCKTPLAIGDTDDGI